MGNSMLDFATQLRLTRVLLNCRQEYVAELFGVHPDTISAWETGLREPLAKVQRRLRVIGERGGLQYDLKGYPQYAERTSSKPSAE